MILVEYASAISVYMSDLTELFSWTCPRCDGKNKHCLQAHVEVAKDLNAMVIAFRGFQEHSLTYYPSMPSAMVHYGFYHAYHNTTIQPRFLDAVMRAKDLYGDINVMVTGHSIGGAMASFWGLDLVGFEIMLMSSTAYRYIIRVVRLYDIGFGSLVYEVEKVCDGSGEDPMCSSITDHLLYYGVELMVETWGSCKIVMDPRLKEYGSEDKGNLMLLRNPSASALRLR
ncbi:hypothetical protein EUGRSUZ_H03849 [Eucalyptus grandis]|uniref:Fungal lipase-type domain-containing protein n=2 Tax=Eucalyptus grandis TaxID=71139 RepID=A0A059B4B2_EUCGR|nr:hypothetical protein EUGRSUZ_H03849 [Eucalyptus grandis]